MLPRHAQRQQDASKNDVRAMPLLFDDDKMLRYQHDDVARCFICYGARDADA